MVAALAASSALAQSARQHRPRDQRQPQGAHRAPDRRDLHPSLGGRRRRRLSPLPLRPVHPEEQRDRLLAQHHLLLQPQARPHRRGARRLRQRQDRQPQSLRLPRRQPADLRVPVPRRPHLSLPPAPEDRPQRLRPRRHGHRQVRRRLQGHSAANLGFWPSTNARPAFSLGGNLDLNLYPNLAFRITPSYTAHHLRRHRCRTTPASRWAWSTASAARNSTGSLAVPKVVPAP